MSSKFFVVNISLILSTFLSVLALALPVKQLCVDLRNIHTFIIEVNDKDKLDLAADQIMFCIFADIVNTPAQKTSLLGFASVQD